MAYGTVQADVIGTSVANTSLGAGNASIMKNRIINGAMVIDQRNAGASVTPTTTGQYFGVDRFFAVVSQSNKFTLQQNAGSVANGGSVVAPAGFTNWLGATSSSAYSILTGDYFAISQRIEGFNTADLGWGTANAKTVTLSAWVYSSLTGTFGGSLNNNGSSRSYPFTYSIPAANTWTQIAITITGDTSGTWITTNGLGIQINFGLGVGTTYSGTAGSWTSGNYVSVTGATSVVGTSGATFYITGVQLEVGSSATGYEYRQYGQELALCYRYYRRYTGSNGAYTALGIGVTASSTSISRWGFMLDIPMRATPSIGLTNCVGWNSTLGGTATAGTNYSSTNYIDIDITTSGILSTAGLAAKILTSGTTGYIELNGAEL